MGEPCISIATITLARDENEEKLLREALHTLAQTGMEVFITDGGSNANFLDFLQSYPQFHLHKNTVKGVFAQARTSVMNAYEAGCDFIFYTEPDKKGFFEQVSNFLAAFSPANDLGILLASRSKNSFATFPAFQQMTETTINNCIKEIIGKAFDFTYGPFIFKSDLAPSLVLIKEEVGWGWRPYIFNAAAKLGYQIDSFEGSFSCPPSQREDDSNERIYRIRQLNQNIDGLLLSTKVELSQQSKK